MDWEYFDEYDHEPCRPRCKFCGSERVYWFDTDDGPRLMNYDNTRHLCRITAADTSEFPLIER